MKAGSQGGFASLASKSGFCFVQRFKGIVPQGIICQIAVVYEYIYRLQEEVEAGLKVGLCQLLSFSSPVERF